MSMRRLGPVAAAVAMAWSAAAAAQPLGPGLDGLQAARPGAAFLVEPIAERTVAALPQAPLYWRVESYPSLEQARAAAGELSLAAEAWGQAWLFTLGPAGGSSPGGRKLAEVGPVPVPPASRYLLRVNRAGGPPGAATPVHTHPGSEAFYVLKGQLTQKTPHGIARLEAGAAMNGHEPGMTMQLVSTGREDLEQLVMFVVDADRPFSSPATFD
ncbi:cupin domain-containing protein [Phenylobacterium terrae]|uniref:Cupin domain-containing protein n=2 Tax=Phenylobacterium terrae TaxID=2665495 RepID=A0ABW4MXN6_9CAUL